MKRGRLPTGSMRMVIRNHLETYQIYTPETQRDGIGQANATYSEGHIEDVWLFNPSTTTTQIDFGEQSEAELMGIALPDAEISKDHRIEYGDWTYEVSSPPEVRGSRERNEFLTFELERVQD